MKATTVRGVRRWRALHPVWFWFVLIILALLGLWMVWTVLASYPVLRGFAIIIGIFWFFAIGVHPVIAGAHTIGNLFDGDES